MERLQLTALKAWKDNPHRKPLLIRGARQVGKTWLMKELGRQAYPSCVYVNFDSNRRMQELFAADLSVERIVTGLELYAGHKINPEATLLIFDEVQEVPKALSALKYFNEDAPQYQIICAGSLLGVALHQGASFPVGKVDFLDLHPLSFPEFLLAVGKKQLADLLAQQDYQLMAIFRQEYIQLLRQYYYVGGMPEAVLHFSLHTDFNEVRAIQQRILAAYEQDFSKHAPSEAVPRLRLLWASIPAQLAKENKKFIYGTIREGARAKDYELAMAWLADCGLVHKVHRATQPAMPLVAYEDFSAFKLFVLDVGLLAAMVDLDARTLLDGNAIFKEFKGALTEQYVLQQLKAQKRLPIYYWSSEKSQAEVDFVVQHQGEVIPVEVKAEENLQAKSLKQFILKHQPRVAVRTSMSDFREEQTFTNLPLYAIGNLTALPCR
jgi:predicted AAA+ superfamily ATPase